MARPVDPLCQYEQFTYRNGGMVPSVAIGQDDLNDLNQKAEITGLHFQNVSDGYVKAMLDTNLFTPFTWQNSPINLRRNGGIFRANLELDLIVPPPKWSRFGTLMSALYAKMLERMTPRQGGAAPTTILEGLESDIWTDRNGQQLRNYPRCFDKKIMISEVPNAETQYYKKFLLSFVEGFSSDEGIEATLDHLLKVNDTCNNFNFERCMVKAPAETSKNQPIVNGVAHCLMYGFHPVQIDMMNEGQARNRRPRGRSRHRVLLPKESGNRQRSRSRSPSPLNDIQVNVENIHNQGPQNPTIRQLLRSPDDYILEAKSLHRYFEPHKPDYLVYQGNRQNGYVEVKLVIEVSSYKKHSGHSMHFCLEVDTEQCLQQCVAALSYNQQKILGLLIIPDGLKLICVQKHIAPGLPDRFDVRESEFMPWSNSQGICMILYEIKAFLMDGWGNPWDYMND